MRAAIHEEIGKVVKAENSFLGRMRDLTINSCCYYHLNTGGLTMTPLICSLIPSFIIRIAAQALIS